MTKSKIEQELEKENVDLLCSCSDTLKNILHYKTCKVGITKNKFHSAIQNALKDLEKKKVCESRVGLHICEKHPEDCYYMIEWSDIIEAFGEITQ